MHLLKKLFGPGTAKATGLDKEREAALVSITDSRTVLDIFNEDLNHICLQTFTKGKSEVQASGDIIQSYYKMLPDKEYGIFDTMYIRLIGSSINVVFKSSRPSEVSIARMKRIINDLYSIYGNDSSNKGRYNDDDTAEYSDKHFYVLFGRDWMDYPRYPYPVTIRRYAEEVFISIWGLSQSNIID